MGKAVLISLLATVAFCAILAAPAAAFKSSTGGYNLYISNLGYGAHNNYTGENYTLDFSLVEQPVANATSSNYTGYLGFYSAVLYLPPTGPFDIIVDAPYSVSPSDVISAAVYLINRHPTTGGDYVVSYWIRDMAGNIAAGPSQPTRQ